MAVTKTEGNYLGDWLVYDERAPQFARELVTIKSGTAAMKTGTVLGYDSGTGKYVTSDASNAAVGILITDSVDASGGDVTNVVALLRGPAVVKKQGLTFIGTNSSGDKTAAYAALTAKNIIVREAQ